MHIRNTIQFATVCTIAAALTACATKETDYSTSRYSSETSVTEASGSSAPQSWQEQEQQYQQQSTARSTRTTGDQNEIVIPLHEEKLSVGKKTVETGQIRIRKVVTTETASQPIELRKESVIIERLPAGQSSQARAGSQFSGDTQAFQEQELTITIREEQPVVEKQVFVGDQFVARKDTDTERVNVEREIRREEIQLDQSGDTANVQISGFGEAAGAERPQRSHQRQE